MFKQSVIAITTALLITCAWAVGATDTAVIIVSHEVADFGEWKKRFDAGKETRKKAGLTERYVMRDASKPNFVIVVLEAGSVENAKKFVSDPGFKERIQKASTSGTADIRIGTTNPTGK
jgi:hypothetical protein